MIPLAPHIRLVQDDASYTSLQGVYEDYCRRNGLNKDEPILFAMDKLRALSEIKSSVSNLISSFNKLSSSDADTSQYNEESAALRMEVFTSIQEKQVPMNVVLETFTRTHSSFSAFWLFRRQFSYQLAALTFMTYIAFMNNRYPHKMSISRVTGNIWGSELIPMLAGGKPTFYNAELVPFRLTPNLQTLMGPLATEGIFSGALMSIARCVTEPEYDLGAILSLFVRDEMIFWFTQNPRSANPDASNSGGSHHQLREIVESNSDSILKRAVSLAEPAVGSLPANQTVIDLVAQATNPYLLAQSDILWMPYL